MKNQLSVYIIGFLLLAPYMSYGQEQNPEADQELLRKDALRFFLDCNRCDIDYIRREIPYVNYVRDVKEAQLYTLMTTQRAGNGGREYTYLFEGQLDFAGMNDTLAFLSMPDDTYDQRRERQLKMLKIGLMRYVAHTPLHSEIDISHSRDLETQDVKDNWNNWVFELRFSPSFEGEETYRELSFFNSVTATKITEAWKFEFDFDHRYNRKSYSLEDTAYTAFRESEDLEVLLVKSLGGHWSAGGQVNFVAATYNNLSFKAEIIPSLEYNIFPYSESTRRQFRFLYGIGYSFNQYIDTTIYDKISEGLYQQSLKMGYEVTQKWGSIDVSLQAYNYLHDFSKNRVELSGHMDFRIIKGLSLGIRGSVARVRDQLSLSKSDLTEEEFLLRLTEVATGYYYYGGVELRYTFGSIYNNIVNPRFERYSYRRF